MIDAVIFDWGGTLTRWHDIDFHAESLALAAAVVARTWTTLGRSSLSTSTHAGCTRPARPCGGGAATASRARPSPTSSTRPGSDTIPDC